MRRRSKPLRSSSQATGVFPYMFCSSDSYASPCSASSTSRASESARWHGLAPAQPVNARIAIGGNEDRVERVAGMRLADGRVDDEQMQVVISEHGYRAIAEAAHEAQRFK